MFVDVGSHCMKNGTSPIGMVCDRCPVREATTMLGCPDRTSIHASDTPSGDATGWVICTSGPASVVSGTTLDPSGAIERRLPSSPSTMSRSAVPTTGDGVVGAGRYGIDVQPTRTSRDRNGTSLRRRAMVRPYDGSGVQAVDGEGVTTSTRVGPGVTLQQGEVVPRASRRQTSA